MLRNLPWELLFLLSILILASPGRGDVAAVQLAAGQTLLRADGRSNTILQATVRDSKGNFVPDGTRIIFTLIGSGRLSARVTPTQSGVARVTLTAPDQPGTATVLAALEASGQSVPDRLVIHYNNEASLAENGDRWIRIEGKRYVGYAVGIAGLSDTVLHAEGVRGGATLAFRDLSVAADRLELQISGGGTILLRTEGNVQIRKGQTERRYNRLLWPLLGNVGNGGAGRGERIDGYRVEQLDIDPVTLDENPVPPQRFIPPKNWRFIEFDAVVKREEVEIKPEEGQPYKLTVGEDRVPPRLVITARSVALEPGRHIQFRRPTFYLDGQKAFSPPFHVMDLGQNTLFRQQILGVGRNGLTLDYPLYYDVRPGGIGTLHVRHGAPIGSSVYSARAGWSLDVEQAYNGRSGIDGVFRFVGLSRRDGGLRLQHSQRFGSRTAASFFVDAPGSRNLFLNAQLSREYDSFRLTATSNLTRTSSFRDPGTGKISTGSEVFGQVFAETNPWRVRGAKMIQYALTGGTSLQSASGGGIGGKGSVRTQNVGMRSYTDSLPLGKDWTFRQSASILQTWVHGSGNLFLRSGASLFGTSAFTRRLRVADGSDLGMLSLSYDYSQTPSITLASDLSTARTGGRHRTSVVLDLGRGNAWNFFASANKGLDSPQAGVDAQLDVALHGPWRTRLRYSSARVDGAGYQETELALIRMIGGREVALYYSTITRRLQLNLAGAGF